MHLGQNSLGLDQQQDQQDQKVLKKFFRFGPATRPTRPKRTKEPIPKPAAHGLKPPKAKEANKFMILKHNIFE